MSRRKLKMRKIKEVLRLMYDCKVSQSKAAMICNCSRASVQGYLMRFTASKLTWPLAEEISDEKLEKYLFPGKTAKPKTGRELDYEYIFKEIRRPNVTLALLWEEYKQSYPDGYQYSQFCSLYREYNKKVSVSMRQEHKAGDKGFVDFGEGLSYINSLTGEEVETELFVFVWGASNYTFSKAARGQDMRSWIKMNVDALNFFGCAPKAIVPDNLKSAVTKASRYEPEINATYTEFASYYGITIFPARPYKPKDKAKVEAGVKLAKRWILARLRNSIFTSLEDMNIAISEALTIFNTKPMRKINKSREELFLSLDKPNAISLPEKPYEYAEWKEVRANIDYHISFDNHNYSVPYTLYREELDVRATINTIEIYKKGIRICSHRRSYTMYGYSTMPEHMPPSHRKYAEWTPERILQWAERYGTRVKELVDKIIQSRKYPEQAYRSCLGIIRLANHYTPERLNAACLRAIEHKSYSYKSVKNILSKGLDKLSKSATQESKMINHENIRGSLYFEENNNQGVL